MSALDRPVDGRRREAGSVTRSVTDETYFAELLGSQTDPVEVVSAEPKRRLAVANGTSTAGDRPTLTTVRASEVTMRSIEWLDKPLVQASSFTLLVGSKGCGKGTWLAKFAAKMTRGVYGKPQSVLFISSEDSASVDLVPRLKAAGADLDRVVIVTEHVQFPRDLGRLADLAGQVGELGGMVIDPIGNHLGAADTDKESAVRFAIGGLNKLADDLGAVLFGVRHLGKSRQNGALSAVLGSTAWVDLPRQVNVFARDNEDDQVVHIQVAAGNRSAHGATEAFRIEVRDVEGLKEPVTYCAELGASSKDVDDLLATPRKSSKSQAAREIILTILENEGSQESDALDARVASEAGLSASTVRNLRVALKNEGLTRNVPVKDEYGTVQRWKVERTNAVRA